MHLGDKNPLAQIFQGMKMESLLKYFTVHLQKPAHAEATLTPTQNRQHTSSKGTKGFLLGCQDMFSSCLLFSWHKKVLQGKSEFSCHFLCFSLLYVWKDNILGGHCGQSIPISKPQSKLEIYRLLTINLIQLI